MSVFTPYSQRVPSTLYKITSKYVRSSVPNDERIQYSSTSESSKERKIKNNALDQRRKQSESDIVLQSINSESEDLDFNSKIFTSFNKSQRRDLVRNRINMQTEQPRHEKTELEIQMQSLEEKMADLLRSSQNSLGDYTTK